MIYYVAGILDLSSAISNFVGRCASWNSPAFPVRVSMVEPRVLGSFLRNILRRLEFRRSFFYLPSAARHRHMHTTILPLLNLIYSAG